MEILCIYESVRAISGATFLGRFAVLTNHDYCVEIIWLVADELVEFEKEPVEVQDFRKSTDISEEFRENTPN